VLQRQDARDRDTTHAWMMVNLAASTWAKGRVPDLQGLLTSGRQPRPQSVAEQKAVLEILAQRLGRPLQTTRTRKDSHARRSGERQRASTSAE
jgi:hypothetical protein